MFKVLFVVGFFLACVQANCLGLSPTPTAQTLTFCTEYSAASCCSTSTDAALARQYQNQIVPFFGSEGCGENIKALLCGFSCSPDQSSFGDFSLAGPSLSIYVNGTVAEELFDSCKERCLPLNPPETAGNYFKTPAGLLSSFNTSNTPGYNVTLTSPDISFHIGTSTQGMGSLTVAQVSGSGTDLTGCNGTDYQCLDPLNPYALPRELAFCTMYNTSSCCTLSQESDLINNFNTKVTPLFGADGCAENIKQLFCAWVCSPKQREISLITPSGGYNTNTVYISQAFANGTYNSCKDRCFVVPGAPALTIEQIYGSSSNPALSFITQFNSSNDPSYKPNNTTHPQVVYQVGATNPLTGDSFESAAIAARGTDLTGCSSTTASTTDDSFAVTSVIPMTFVIVASVVAVLISL